LATTSVPMLPPAPARFSMTKGCPRISAIFGVTVRATMSVPPPGGNGTMTRIGFDGKFCASAALAASKTARNRCFISLLVVMNTAVVPAKAGT